MSLNTIFQEASLKDNPIAIFMMDIDNLKKYNDYWGHSQEDICISEIANSIKNTQRSTDNIFARYGGEEFVYISKDINYEQALGLGDRIRNQILNLELYYISDSKNIM